MTISNFHADGLVTDQQLLERSSGFFENIRGVFRQAAANGNFTFGFIKLHDTDLNRLHSIIVEIDTRRLFYSCGEDENPQYTMKSLYEARTEIRNLTKGVWATPECEIIVQEISYVLAEACTEAEKLGVENIIIGSDTFFSFIDVITNMRLKVWTLVAVLKKKTGSIINPKNMPSEIFHQACESGL